MSLNREYITPERAKYYLSINDPDNRDRSEELVDTYRLVMEIGQWDAYSKITIWFGKLTNGQHRMEALSRCKDIEGIWFTVINHDEK